MAETAASGRAHGAGARPAGREQRVTKQKLAVGAALDELVDFVSTQELHRILQDRGDSVSLATTYRVLQTMAEDGLVDVLRTDDGEAVYRRCAAHGHHHHLVCRRCGKAVEIEAPAVEAWASRVAAENGYTVVEHTVEIFGLCPECTAEAAAEGPGAEGTAAQGPAAEGSGAQG